MRCQRNHEYILIKITFFFIEIVLGFLTQVILNFNILLQIDIYNFLVIFFYFSDFLIKYSFIENKREIIYLIVGSFAKINLQLYEEWLRISFRLHQSRHRPNLHSKREIMIK